METRQITQVKIWVLTLNHMKHPKIEMMSNVAIAYDKQVLINWYEEQKCPTYKDGDYHKSFKKGSKLEWYNPMNSTQEENNYEEGLYSEWVSEDTVQSAIGTGIILVK